MSADLGQFNKGLIRRPGPTLREAGMPDMPLAPEPRMSRYKSVST